MFKFVAFFALCAVALGAIFTPKLQPCAVHVRVDEYDDYIMLSSPYEGYMYMENTSNGMVEIIRCDVKNDNGFCLYVTRDPAHPENCTDDWTDPAKGDWFNMEYYYRCMDAPFEYTAGPEACDCPVYNPTRGDIPAVNCTKYTNGDKFIIVDSENRLVQNVEGWIMTYTNDAVPVSKFVLDDCKGKHYNAPVDICKAKHTVQPKITPCAYHIKAEEYDDKIMLVSPSEGYMRMVNTTSKGVEIIRCDVKNEKGECLYITRYENGTCVPDWTDPKKGDYWNMEYLYRCEDSAFQYIKGEIEVECPSAESAKNGPCKMYINDKTDIILDNQGRIVRDVDQWVVTWYDDKFDTKEFVVDDCDGKHYDAPVDVCKMPHVVEPTITPCAYHIKAEEYDDKIMLVSASEGYLRMVNTLTGGVETIRCDVKNEKGECLYITRYDNGTCIPDWTDPKKGDYWDMEYLLRCMDSPFQYIKGDLEVECPSEESAKNAPCKLYIGEKTDTILDNKGRTVRDVDGWLVTWFDDKIDTKEFVVDDCDGKHYDAPVDICKEKHTVQPKQPPCAFHVYLDEYEDHIMLASSSEGYMRMVNKTSGGIEIIRCDVKNDKGFCLYVTHYPDGTCVPDWTDPAKGDYWDMEYLYNCMFLPFDYIKGPLNVECPVYSPVLRGNLTSEGCKLYIGEKTTVIIDSENRTVQDNEGWVFTWTDDPVDVKLFEVDDCEGKHYGVPKDVCQAPVTPSGSSASTVISSALLVVFALLVALF